MPNDIFEKYNDGLSVDTYLYSLKSVTAVVVSDFYVDNICLVGTNGIFLQFTN